MKENNQIWARDKAVQIHDETADWFADKYDKTGDNLSSSFSYGRHEINRFLFNEISNLPKGAAILDVGCGTGHYLKELMDRGFRVSGVEPSVNMREHAESRLPKGTVVGGSVLSLPFEDNSFDFVFSIEVFRYLNNEDNMQGLKEIIRVLKPGGTFLGTFLNYYALDGFNILVAIRKLKDRWLGKPMRFHTEFETPKKLEKKLIGAGFSKIQIHGSTVAPLMVLYRINRFLGKMFAKVIEPVDAWLSDIPIFRPFSVYLIAIVKKK